MAYTTNNLSLLVGKRDGLFNVWHYVSADAITTVRAANYITDAVAKGMKVQDLVIVQDTASPTLTLSIVIAVAAAGADLSDGTAIAQTNS